jgi:decaprenyl-phosphate phosphoribosyltransferase
MGLVYNVPPVRAKELPYFDVIVESVNNPIRLLLGWFTLIPDHLPPLSLVLAYWALGAYFMATKRYAELRAIGDREVAGRYRRSFRHYTEERLLVSLFFYALSCAFFGGVFIVRCKLELVLGVPLVAGMLAYYFALGLRPNSPVQHPERLHLERGFFLYSLGSIGFFVLLLFVDLPQLYELFHFDRPVSRTLWSWQK